MLHLSVSESLSFLLPSTITWTEKIQTILANVSSTKSNIQGYISSDTLEMYTYINLRVTFLRLITSEIGQDYRFTRKTVHRSLSAAHACDTLRSMHNQVVIFASPLL